jgi:hypothetical protein
MAKMQRGCGSVICLLGVFLLLLAGSVQATTWNEPWHEEVMLASDSFVKVRIIEVRDTGCKAEVLKFLGGATLPKQFELAGFSKLSLTSFSSAGHEVRMPFQIDQTYYLFVTRSPKTNAYQIPTPTRDGPG